MPPNERVSVRQPYRSKTGPFAWQDRPNYWLMRPIIPILAASDRRGSELLTELVELARQRDVALGELLQRFGRRSFGVLLLVITLPAFVPLPVGGGLVGPLIMLLGLQLALGYPQPWLPRRLRELKLRHETLQAALQRLIGPMRRVERLARPAWPALRGRGALAFSGVVLAWLGLALAMPIPFTNYPLGLLLLVYAIGLIEGDGRFIAACWTLALLLLLAVLGVGGIGLRLVGIG